MDPALVEMLDESGLDYELQHKSKHVQVRVRGRVVVTVPRDGEYNCRAAENARAALRRHLRGLGK